MAMSIVLLLGLLASCGAGRGSMGGGRVVGVRDPGVSLAGAQPAALIMRLRGGEGDTTAPADGCAEEEDGIGNATTLEELFESEVIDSAIDEVLVQQSIYTKEHLDLYKPQWEKELREGIDPRDNPYLTPKPGTEEAWQRPELREALEMVDAGQPPTYDLDVGQARWTSDVLRSRWNQTGRWNQRCPAFVPMSTWTLQHFQQALNDPLCAKPEHQEMIEDEYKRLSGIPQSIDPREGDIWLNERGEANCWGADPLSGVLGGTTEGLRVEDSTRLLLQNTLWEVQNINETYAATEVVTMMAAIQALGIVDYGGEVKQLFPLRDDEYLGPQWRNSTQKTRALGMLRDALEQFLGPEYPPLNLMDQDLVTEKFEALEKEHGEGWTELYKVPEAGWDYELNDPNRKNWEKPGEWVPDFRAADPE